MAESSAGVRRNVATFQPRAASSAFSIFASSVAARPRPVVKRTFPLAMWVETPVKPVSSKSCRSLSIFTTRPPTFTARRKAAYRGTPRL